MPGKGAKGDMVRSCRWRLKRAYGFLEIDRLANQLVEQPFIDLGATPILSQIALVMALAKNADGHGVQTFDRMGKRLKDDIAIFRAEAFQP